MPVRRKSVINFNHIDTTLDASDVGKLQKLYSYYHRLATCYKRKYKRLKRTKLALGVFSVGLTLIGWIAGGVTANPIVLGSGRRGRQWLQAYTVKTGIARMVETLKFAYIMYQKVLTRVMSFIRGVRYDEVVFLSQVQLLDGVVVETCPPCDSMSERYKVRYGS